MTAMALRSRGILISFCAGIAAGGQHMLRRYNRLAPVLVRLPLPKIPCLDESYCHLWC
jgi:hypothetical protein